MPRPGHLAGTCAAILVIASLVMACSVGSGPSGTVASPSVATPSGSAAGAACATAPTPSDASAWGPPKTTPTLIPLLVTNYVACGRARILFLYLDGSNAVRIAKEEQEKSGDDEQRDTDKGSREQPDECSYHQGPEYERPAGWVDSHKVVSSLLPDEAEVETGSDFRGLKHSGNQTRFPRRGSGGSKVGLGELERHLLHLIFEG